MATAPLKWKAMAGFLVMNSLISGTSALVCFQFTYYKQLYSPGYVTAPGKNITCSPDQNACIDAQLELSILSHALFVIHRDCGTTKHPNRGKESTTSGDKYFAIKYNASYCSSDLCNTEPAVAEVPEILTRVKERCKPSSSKKCYSALNFHDSEASLEAVTCRSDFDQCYQGTGEIKIGNGALLLYIKSCQSTCNVPKKQVFGPIEINVPQGACCFGNYCNKKENADPTWNDHTLGAASELYGKGAVNHTSNSTNLDSGYGLHWDFECENYVEEVLPKAQEPTKSKGATLQLSPLLVTLGVTILGLWW